MRAAVARASSGLSVKKLKKMWVRRQALHTFCDGLFRIVAFVRHDVVAQAFERGVGVVAVEIEQFVCECAVVVRPQIRFSVFCRVSHVAANGA